MFSKSGNTFLTIKVEQFAASSIDLRLICFTKTSQYLEWMKVKDILAIEIKDIVEKNKASFSQALQFMWKKINEISFNFIR